MGGLQGDAAAGGVVVVLVDVIVLFGFGVVDDLRAALGGAGCARGASAAAEGQGGGLDDGGDEPGVEGVDARGVGGC